MSGSGRIALITVILMASGAGACIAQEAGLVGWALASSTESPEGRVVGYAIGQGALVALASYVDP